MSPPERLATDVSVAEAAQCHATHLCPASAPSRARAEESLVIIAMRRVAFYEQNFSSRDRSNAKPVRGGRGCNTQGDSL